MLSAIGTGEYGTLTSEGGYIFEGELSHTDWIIDPALMNYDNLICIDGWYEDADGSFHYAMYLRPWGTLWDDIAADSPDNLPYYYDSWYLPLIEAGKEWYDSCNMSENVINGLWQSKDFRVLYSTLHRHMENVYE